VDGFSAVVGGEDSEARLQKNEGEIMPRFFHLHVDVEALTDELYAFVIDPRPTRNERPVIEELHDVAPDVVSVVEYMVLDGVDQREDVADYVTAVFGDGSD
jgi:hypothetical protein